MAYIADMLASKACEKSDNTSSDSTLSDKTTTHNQLSHILQQPNMFKLHDIF